MPTTNTISQQTQSQTNLPPVKVAATTNLPPTRAAWEISRWKRLDVALEKVNENRQHPVDTNSWSYKLGCGIGNTAAKIVNFFK